MVTRYVWWDEIQKRERTRVDLRVPTPLYDFLQEVAKVNGVSVNAFICGALAYIADADQHKRLRIQVEPAVRVTEVKPDSAPVEMPVQAPTPAATKRWKIPKVR